jgi:hypothetical protein
MNNYHGDILPARTIRIGFNTVNTSGVPTTLAGTPTVLVSRSGTDVTPSGGVTLSVDVGSVVGRHSVILDTSIDAAAFAASNDFGVRLGAGTVGGVSVVGAIVGSFSILNRSTIPDATGKVVLSAVVHTGATIPTVTTYTGNTPQTGDVAAIFTAPRLTKVDNLLASGTYSTFAGGSVASVAAPVTLAAGTIVSATFGAGATIPRVTLADTAATVTDKAGYGLSATGLDAVGSAPQIGAPTTLVGKLMWLAYHLGLGTVVKDSAAGTIVTKVGSSTVMTTQTFTSTTTVDTVNPAT